MVVCRLGNIQFIGQKQEKNWCMKVNQLLRFSHHFFTTSPRVVLVDCDGGYSTKMLPNHDKIENCFGNHANQKKRKLQQYTLKFNNERKGKVVFFPLFELKLKLKLKRKRVRWCNSLYRRDTIFSIFSRIEDDDV